MGKVILIAGIVFIALAVIEIIWFILRGITSVQQCTNGKKTGQKGKGEETREPEKL